MASNLILGLSSTALAENERRLFDDLQPWGIILFARNILNPQQLIRLIEDCKNAMQREHLMVFIDQEGGRVSRLPKSHWRVPPSPVVFAKMYENNPQTAKQACLLNAMLTGLELKALGINANCAPMLDLPQVNTNRIITERALGNTPQQVIALATQIAEGLKRAGVAPVIKHMPGHGRATSDSHLELPTVSASLSELNKWDFVPFKALNTEAMAMTAHIIFEQIDASLPATTSPTMINNIMRRELGFDGLIMTDDINMHALSGTVLSRAEQALGAGCDIVLHCSGVFEEMQSLAPIASVLTGKQLKRAEAAQRITFKDTSSLSGEEIEDQLTTLMETVA